MSINKVAVTEHLKKETATEVKAIAKCPFTCLMVFNQCFPQRTHLLHDVALRHELHIKNKSERFRPLCLHFQFKHIFTQARILSQRLECHCRNELGISTFKEFLHRNLTLGV